MDDKREVRHVRRGAVEQSRRGLPNYLPSTAPPSPDVLSDMHALATGESGENTDALKKAALGERRRPLVHIRLPIEKCQERFGWLLCADEVSNFS